ncbi:UNVERIFIED_CONTAM: hypothetical protein Slati_2433100 [Sesamum latifolium]|uniref:Uncharacterized protein n=1 Tax=Sesamum latifolium TaxID=2727402 RepID=A0AAW2WFD2_9LAMI
MQVEVVGVEVEVAGLCIADSRGRLIAGRSRLLFAASSRDHVIGDRSRSLFKACNELAVTCDLGDPLNSWVVLFF